MNVWSLFLNISLIVGTPAVFAGCIGLVQAMIGHTPWDLWVLGLMLVAAAGLYVIAQFGQKPGGAADVFTAPSIRVRDRSVCGNPLSIAKERGFFTDAALDMHLSRAIDDQIR